MELRSTRQQKEYKELQITLNGMGVYEEGMELAEMRQILSALEMSANDGETCFFESDMQQAIRESELDFMPSQNGTILNSTMAGYQQNSLLCCSPEIPSHTVVVHADVHHPMDWSPPNERKRLGSSSTTTRTWTPDEVNNSQQQEIDNDSLEPSPKRFHAIRGPVSMRRLQDSGVNMSNENEMSSSVANTTNENSNSSLSNAIVGDNVEPRFQFSTSSPVMSGEHERFVEDDDYEKSEPSM